METMLIKHLVCCLLHSKHSVHKSYFNNCLLFVHFSPHFWIWLHILSHHHLQPASKLKETVWTSFMSLFSKTLRTFRLLKTKDNKQNIAKRLAIIHLLFRGCPYPDYDCAFYEKCLSSLLIASGLGAGEGMWEESRGSHREEARHTHCLPSRSPGLGLGLKKNPAGDWSLAFRQL